MKKMKLLALSAVLCLALGATAQAAGSSSGVVQVSQEPVKASVTDKTTGESLGETDVVPAIASGSTEVSAEEAKSALGISSDDYDSYVLDVTLQTLDEKTVDLSSGSIDVTFKIPSVTPSSKVAVLHWADGSNTPESLPATAGDGTVTATFTSFSPVQILVANESSSGDSGSGSSGSGSSGSSSSGSSSSGSSSSGSSTAPAAVSPKTAEGSELYVAAAVAVLALAGTVVFTKKARS